jgi:hypothetical protein
LRLAVVAPLMKHFQCKSEALAEPLAIPPCSEAQNFLYAQPSSPQDLAWEYLITPQLEKHTHSLVIWLNSAAKSTAPLPVLLQMKPAL